MINQLKFSDFQPLVMKMGGEMREKQEELAELDSKIGDGDIGVTVILCFRAMEKVIKSYASQSIAELLKIFSNQVGDTAPSTFGTLISTMLSAMSAELSEVQVIDSNEFARALKAAGEAVMKRGGAKPGDKTMLDALVPAAEAAAKSAKAGDPLPVCAEKSAAEAIAGSERCAELEAKIGRAGYLGGRTVGIKDPGAEAIALMLTSFREFLQNN